MGVKGCPLPRVLQAIRNDATGSWERAICEFVDNSFDADANQVFVGFPKPKSLTVSDDGLGCADLSKLYILGDREDHATTDIGHYGYGCTQSMIWLWGSAKLTSRTPRDDGRTITVVWDKVAASLDWDYGDELAAPESKPGTEIVLHTCRSHPPLDKIRATLARKYSPAIERGKQILFSRGQQRPVPLPSVPLPPLDAAVESEFEVSGKRVSIKVGVVKEGEDNPFRGLSFERTYRVIKDQCALGAGEYGVARVAGRVYLSRDWKLSTNKDDFAELEDELGDAIYCRCKHIFEAASAQCVDIEFASFNRELDQMLNETLRQQRERREKPEEPEVGTVIPKETQRKRRRAAKVSDKPGGVGTPGGQPQRRGFSLEWLQLDGATVGDYDDSAKRVRLNLANPWMAARRKEKNAVAIVPVIFLILADYNQRQSDVKRPLFNGQDRALLPTLGAALIDAMDEGRTNLSGVA